MSYVWQSYPVCFCSVFKNVLVSQKFVVFYLKKLNYFVFCFLLSFMSLFNVLYCSSYSWCSFQALLFAIDKNNFCYPFFLFNKYRLDTLFVLMGIV